MERLAAVVTELSDAELVAPTRCAGWLAAHLMVHLRLGLAEAAVSFAEPAGPGETDDRDYVSYWRDFPAAAEPATYAEVRFHWANASAYVSADMMRQHFSDTARAAAGLSRNAPAGSFRFQGHVMDADDILVMWAVEWVVHQLDLYPGGRPAVGPVPEALALAVQTMDGLTGAGARPESWDDVTYILKGTGRIPLDDADRGSLTDRAQRYPAFG